MKCKINISPPFVDPRAKATFVLKASRTLPHPTVTPAVRVKLAVTGGMTLEGLQIGSGNIALVSMYDRSQEFSVFVRGVGTGTITATVMKDPRSGYTTLWRPPSYYKVGSPKMATVTVQ